MDRQRGGAVWPPSLRRTLGIPPSAAAAAAAPASNEAAKLAAEDDGVYDDSDSDFGFPAPPPSPIVKNSASSSAVFTARQLRNYIHDGYAALTSIQRQLHRGEESYFEETYAHGNLFQGFDNIWIEQHPTSSSAGGGGGASSSSSGAAGGSGGAGGGGESSLDGSSRSGGGAAENNSGHGGGGGGKQPKSVPVRRMPSDRRWFSSSCGAVPPTVADGRAALPALGRPSLVDRPPTPEVEEDVAATAVGAAATAGGDASAEGGNDEPAKASVVADPGGLPRPGSKASSNKESSAGEAMDVDDVGGIVTDSAGPEPASSLSSSSLKERADQTGDQPKMLQLQPGEQSSTKKEEVPSSSSSPTPAVPPTRHGATSAPPVEEGPPKRPAEFSGVVEPGPRSPGRKLDVSSDLLASPDRLGQICDSISSGVPSGVVEAASNGEDEDAARPAAADADPSDAGGVGRGGTAFESTPDATTSQRGDGGDPAWPRPGGWEGGITKRARANENFETSRPKGAELAVGPRATNDATRGGGSGPYASAERNSRGGTDVPPYDSPAEASVEGGAEGASPSSAGGGRRTSSRKGRKRKAVV